MVVFTVAVHELLTVTVVDEEMVEVYDTEGDGDGEVSIDGGELSSVVPPFPSCPKMFQPQHRNPPSLISVQVCSYPAAIRLTLARRSTAGGEKVFVVPPSPS